MPDPTEQRPSARHALLRGARHAPLLHAALVFLVTLLVTFAAWSSARRAELTDLQNNFDFRAREMATSIGRRMAVYEQVLRGAQGFLRGTVDIDRREFAEYFDVLKLDEHFPGIEALAIAAIIPPVQLAAHEQSVRAAGFPAYAVHPPGPRETYTSITHIEPFKGRNLRAFGYDMFSEPVRRAAMEAARDTGKSAVSGKVKLVQEGEGDVQPGFLMYLPVYRAAMPVATRAQRREAIVGWVYSPFRMHDLMSGLGGEHVGDLDVRLYDGERQQADALLYRSPNAVQRTPMFSGARTITVGGRPWTVAIASAPSFEARLDNTRPLVIAITGTGLGFLLSLVVWLLASERRRALELAREMTLELRQSYSRIEAERTRMAVILQNAHDAFVAVDPQGRVTDWNVQATHLFGWTAQEALGRDLADLLVPPEHIDDYRKALARIVREGKVAVAGTPEVMLRHRSGHLVAVELALAALPTEAGHGASAFLRDIGPRKEAEARERQRQQRLDDTRAALQRSQKLEAVGKLTGGVAHDFNNLLHIISANVQLLLRTGEHSRKRLQSILEAVERGARLSAQLLAFARRQPLHPSVVNVAELIERMDSLLQRAAGESVRLNRISQGDLWNALVDPNQLENVILNLVINARDAMDGQGSVGIELKNVAFDADGVPDPEMAPGEYVLIAVSDTGSGMPPEVMERAFEPFYTTKPEGKGTGLGLSMAHGFVKQSGGHIRLASKPGQGTTVSIYLPRHAGERAAAGREPALTEGKSL